MAAGVVQAATARASQALPVVALVSDHIFRLARRSRSGDRLSPRAWHGDATDPARASWLTSLSGYHQAIYLTRKTPSDHRTVGYSPPAIRVPLGSLVAQTCSAPTVGLRLGRVKAPLRVADALGLSARNAVLFTDN